MTEISKSPIKWTRFGIKYSAGIDMTLKIINPNLSLPPPIYIYIYIYKRFGYFGYVRGSLHKFPGFFVWALLLIVHTWNSNPIRSNLLRLQCTCCTVPTTSGRPHSNPNPKPLANQLWCIDFLTPPTPLIIPGRLPAFLESLMPLKNWCSIPARWSKSSLKHSIRFCGIIFSRFKTEFYCISFF